MNTQIPSAPAWPLVIERHEAGRLNVVIGDGRCVELGAFKDDCRERALALRREAMADAARGAFAVLRRLSGAAVHFLRSTPGRAAGAHAHGA